MSRILMILMLFGFQLTYAQDVLDDIAKNSCSCVKMEDFDSMSAVELQNQFGVCLIQEALKYPSELLEQHDLDLSTMDESTGQQLGTLVAGKMLTHCPDVLLKLGAKAQEEELAHSEVLSLSGTILSVEASDFVQISVRNDADMVKKFIWLQNFPGSYQLVDYESAKDKKVKIEYRKEDFFDPRIKDYRSFNVITSMEFL